MAFDSYQYLTLKNAGNIVSATQDGSGNITIVRKTYCPDTGVQGPNTSSFDTVADLNALITSAQAAIASYQQLLTDSTPA